MVATINADGGELNVNSVAGSATRLQVVLTDADDQPLDASGWSFAGQLRWSPNDVVVAELSFDTTELADGVVYALLAQGDAAVGRYVYAVEYDDGGGLGMLPLLFGTWTLRPQRRY